MDYLQLRRFLFLAIIPWWCIAPVFGEEPASLWADRLFAMDTCTQRSDPENKRSPEQQLDLVKQLGYSGMSWPGNNAVEVRNLVSLARQRGLKLHAVYTGISLEKGKLNYGRLLEDPFVALEGSDTQIWLFVTSPDTPKSSPTGDSTAVDGLRKVAGLAEARKLQISLYPHVGNWLERVQDAVRVVKKVDRKNVGVTFNLCHCLAVGDEEKIPELLTEATPYLTMVTINGADRNVTEPNWDRLILTLDRGNYDVSLLLGKLRELNYSGPIGLQGYGWKGNVRDNLARSMQAWQRFATKLQQNQAYKNTLPPK